MSLEEGGSGNANDELRAWGEGVAGEANLNDREELSGPDKQIVDAGYSNRYTIVDIRTRLQNNLDFLQEVREDTFLDIVRNWFNGNINKQQYPTWVRPPRQGPEAQRYAGDVKRETYNFRNIALNGVTYYTARQGSENGSLSNQTPPPFAAEGSDDLLGLYTNSENVVKPESGLLEESTLLFQEFVDSVNLDINLPDDVKIGVQGLDRAQGRLQGGLFAGEADEGSITDFTQQSSEQLLREAEEAREIFYGHYIWLYYVYQSQNTTQLSARDVMEPARQLSEVYKDTLVHQLLIASINIHQHLEQEQERLTERLRTADPVFQDNIREDLEQVEEQLAGGQQGILEDLVGVATGDDDEPDLSEAELAQQRRLSEQTFLLDFLDIYAKQNQTRNEKYLSEDGDPHFIMVHGKTDTIVNQLMYNPSMEELDKIKTSELSGLVPKIKLFKSSFLPTSDYLRGREIKHEIPFRTHIHQQEISDMLNKTFDRGQGAGVKKFEWRLEGRDPFAARRDIFARLELYFQSMDEFIKIRGAPRPRYADNGEEYDDEENPLEFRYVDLVNIGMAHPEKNFIWNPDYYKLEAEVGWHMPQGTGDASTFLSEGTRQAINSSTMFLHLSAYDHEININDEGNVTLVIEYLAWQEGIYQGPDSDILSTPERRADRLQALRVLTEAQKGGCPDQYIADLEEAYKKKVRQQNVESWSRILNTLYEQDKVFYTKLDPSLLDLYLAGSRADRSQPLLEELGVRGSISNFDAEANSNVNSGPTTEAIANRIPSTLDGSELSDADSVLDSLKNLTYNQDDDQYHLQFFYFGDLLQSALDVVHTDVSPTEDRYGSISRLKENTRIILGPISYKVNVKSEDDPPQYKNKLIYDISLADIPISVTYFIDWFLTKIVSQERTIYPILSFIREISSDLIANAMRQQGGERNVARQDLQLRTNFFTAAGTGRGGDEKLYSLRNVPPPPDTYLMAGRGSQLTPEQQELYRPSTEELGALLSGDETAVARAVASRVNLETIPQERRPILKPPESQGQETYDYMLLYAINAGAVQNLNGDLRSDKERGIYHFGIGKPEGIIKRISFSKTDIPFIRESRLEQEFLGQITGLAVLANVYNATVECYGTTMFHPGMKIYINPVGLSPDFGNPTIQGSASNVLGIGGYHVVTKVQSYIERGAYVTTVTAIWESPGASSVDTRGSLAQVSEDGGNCGPTRIEISSMISSMR